MTGVLGFLGLGKKETAPVVLVVDDEIDTARLLQKILTATGYSVLLADNGADAVKLALSRRPALILLDINMPVMDGRQTLGMLKSDPRTKAIPVIMTTAERTFRDVEDAFGTGACEYVMKPFQMSDLVGKVRKILPPGPA